MFRGVAYNYKESFALLERCPYSLTQGDLKTNIRNLSAAEPVKDLVAGKLQMALQCDQVDGEVFQVLRLQRDCPCSTGIWEKGHKVGALLSGEHKLYSTGMLTARSLVCQAERLLNPGPDDKFEGKLRLELNALEYT